MAQRSSHSHEIKLNSVINFASNSMLKYKSHPLPEPSPPHRAQTLWFLYHGSGILQTHQKPWHFIVSRHYFKATWLGKISVVHKNHSPKLSPILTTLLDCCLKEKCFQSLWMVSAVFKNANEHSFLSQYHPISLLSVTSKNGCRSPQ